MSQESEEKRVDLCEFIYDNQDEADYVDLVASINDMLSPQTIDDYTVETCATELGVILNDSTNQSVIDDTMAQVTTQICDSTQDVVTDFDVEEQVGSLNLDSDTIDILNKNLEGESNTIRIYADIDTNLPLDVTIVAYIVLSDSTKIKIASLEELDLDETIGKIETTEQLQEILDDMYILAEINLNNYNPANGDLDLEDKNLTITLKVRKTGAIVF